MWPLHENVSICAGIEELHGEEVDVFVSTRGAVDVATRFRERRRIADQQVIARRRFVYVVERVGDGEDGVDTVQCMIRPSQMIAAPELSTFSEEAAPPAAAYTPKAPLYEKSFEHAAVCCERSSQLAILALIEKEFRLLARRRIDTEAQSILANLGRQFSVSDPLRLDRQPFDFPCGDVVLEPDAARRASIAWRRWRSATAS